MSLCYARSSEDETLWHDRFVQQARWTAELRRHLFARLAFTRARRLLEVGCGTGAILASLSLPLAEDRSSPFFNQTGTGQVRIFGLDLNHAFISLAARNVPTALFTRGDGHLLPYASASFDLVLCHYLLLWVAHPLQVIIEMARVTHPAGWVLALAEPDYGGRVDYPTALAELGVRQEAALRRQGAETRMGRRLSALFHTAGLHQVETGVLGGQWSAAPSPQDWEQEWATLEADLAGEASPDEIAQLKKLDAKAWQRGERTLFVPTFYAIGQV